MPERRWGPTIMAHSMPPPPPHSSRTSLIAEARWSSVQVKCVLDCTLGDTWCTTCQRDARSSLDQNVACKQFLPIIMPQMQLLHIPYTSMPSQVPPCTEAPPGGHSDFTRNATLPSPQKEKELGSSSSNLSTVITAIIRDRTIT